MNTSSVSAFVAALLVLAACAGDEAETGGSTPATSGAAVDVADSVESDAEPAEPAMPDQVEGPLEWASCADQLGLGATKECATLVVPLDHADPEGETIEIAVARYASAGTDRIGSLVFNPGGPGASGVEFLDQAVIFTPPEVATRFDLVSFDPRGVGVSTAIDCDLELDDNVTLLPAGDDEAWERLISEDESLQGRCSEDAVALARYVGTNNAARDLDLLRAALGDEQLSYVGYSYGTRLGATYAELFPESVRALVLDAAVTPTGERFQVVLGQAAGFDRALENFAAACDADEDCILGDIGPTLDVIEDLRAEIADVGSFPTDDDDRVLEPGELDLGIFAALYSTNTWPILAQALFVAETQQDGTLLQVLGDNFAGRRPDGSYSNLQVANSFINCADDPSRPDAAATRAQSDELAAASKYFAAFFRADTGCFAVPEALDPLIIGPAAGAPPILVIGNTGDPATPFEWSEELTASLDSGVLFTVEAEGHTAYGTIECVADAVNRYLIDLEVPAEDSSCSDNATADFFVPSGESDVDLIVALFDCLRENGLDVPPLDVSDIVADTTGQVIAEFLDPSDPAFVAAVQACEDIVLQIQQA